jgi:drug/metabolite transporter (DMT)-like permease
MGTRPLPLAVAGTACISSSAVLMQLAGTSASLTALGRCAFALPVLAALVWLDRRRGAARLAARNRWLARFAGLFLAADLVVWSHAISDIGAGLGTVVPNLQVLILSVLGWLILGERPRRSLLLASPVMVAGLALVAGLGGGHAYGADPAAGVLAGAFVAVLYSIYVFTLRHATAADRDGIRPSPVATLFEATLGAAAGSVVAGLALHDFHFGHPGAAHTWQAHNWQALGWLALLAITSQVIGWLLITASMSRLPAWTIGVVLLIQPAGSVSLGYLILNERPSLQQMAGVGLMLVGVLAAVGGRGRAVTDPATAQDEDHAPGARSIQGEVAVEVAVPGGDAEAAS